MTKELHIDIETYSSVSLSDCGVYRYAAAPDFRLLLFAYYWAWPDGHLSTVQVVDATRDWLPRDLMDALQDDRIRKVAHNAAFERVCLSRYIGQFAGLPQMGTTEFLDPAQWDCSMVQCARCGLPLSLEEAGKALGLPQQKLSEGRRLIQLFCKPHKAREGLFRTDGGCIDPDDYPQDWVLFMDYCRRDVEVEREILARLRWHRAPEFKRVLYAIDQRINDRGVLLDRTLVGHAVRMDALYKARLSAEACRITGLDNPNSLTQLKTWLSDRLDRRLDALRKDDVQDLLREDLDPDVRRVLEIRAEMGKTSCKKYTAMLACAGEDDRVRGLLLFHGTKTGRWAGRLVQMQNLPQNHLDTLEDARRMLVEDDMDSIELCYGNVPGILSQLIRTAFVAPEGKTLAVCDFSAIEARVLAWLAGEEWVLDVFRGGGDIYCATASQMFHLPVEKHGQNAHLRQKGKIAVLALGYQGAVGALDKMGGQRMGLSEEEEAEIVGKWRDSNPHIVALWAQLEQACYNAVSYRSTETVAGRLVVRMQGGDLTITLPSGRMLVYPSMQEGVNRKGKKSLMYMGLIQETKKWGWVETYGGKLTENVVQAIARDCLAETMLRTETAGIPVVFHVHDELVCEVEDASVLDTLKRIFSTPIPWAPGLPLKGAGYTKEFYLKD